MLLDIVAKSLYSEKEVFIRELISNASDALEKFRYAHLSGTSSLEEGDRTLEIRIETDKQGRKLTIQVGNSYSRSNIGKYLFVFQDNGIGMTKEELISNLGVIARSGSKVCSRDLEKIV